MNIETRLIMETEKELNVKIIAIILRIQQEYPELCKYLNEMPITIPAVENPIINVEILKNYYESLLKLLTTYQSEKAEKRNKKS